MYEPLSRRCRNGRRRCCVAALLAAALLAPAARGGITAVITDRSYVPAGEAVKGTVRLTLGEKAPADPRLRITVVRSVDVPTGERSPAGRGLVVVSDKPLGAKKGNLEVPFAIDTAGMLFGTLQVKAELRGGRDAPPLSAAWAEPVNVGVRRRVNLAGQWQVAGVKAFEGEMPRRRKDWKMPPLPAAVTVPGPLPFDEGYRGWLTVRRKVAWKAAGQLRPRFVFVDGASDSALVRVNGTAVGETTPADDYAALTRWLEFHCRYKGPKNLRKRYLLMAGGCEYPSRFWLPKALPAEGTAEVEMVIRGTSGGIMGRGMRPYGVLNGMHLEMAPAACVRSVSFDTSKPGEKRRFTFRLAMVNDSGRALAGKLRAVYGQYAGKVPYSGACPAVATAEQAVTIPAGESTVEVLRDERPRFATCRATFLLVGADGKVLDAAQQDYHTVTMEIRDRRDLYLNNERFIVKFQGSWGEDHSTRLQLRAKGGNGFRSHRWAPSRRVPGWETEAANVNDRYADGLLTSAGGALLASCEKCTFWDPKDTSNIHKAVRWFVRRLGPCPGVVMWEATNELHGEPEAARVEILKAFQAADPYHRPVLATKGSGEWEAEARDGRIAGVDIVGCQYLLSVEATDSIVSAVTEQPVMSTEVNWNDGNLRGKANLFAVWLAKGLCGSLLFDYSGNSLTQGVPLVPAPDNERDGSVIRQSDRRLYQDTVATARQQADGSVVLTVGNRMPYVLRNVVLHVAKVGRFEPRELPPGDAVEVRIPARHCPRPREHLAVRASFTTHGGLEHTEILAPRVEAAPRAKGGAK